MTRSEELLLISPDIEELDGSLVDQVMVAVVVETLSPKELIFGLVTS